MCRGAEEIKLRVRRVSKRPKVTASVVVHALKRLHSSMCGDCELPQDPRDKSPANKLRMCTSQSERIHSLMQLYRNWAATVFPALPFESFTEKVASFSGNHSVSRFLHLMARKQAGLDGVWCLRVDGRADRHVCVGDMCGHLLWWCMFISLCSKVCVCWGGWRGEYMCLCLFFEKIFVLLCFSRIVTM